MDLHLKEQEQQLLKNVLHALYKTFRMEPGMNYGTCHVTNISREDLKMIIGIHDNIVDYELKQNNPDVDASNPAMKPALDYVRSQLDECRLDEYRASINSAYEYHTTPTAYADFDCIRDLLEEYGQENGLPECWWESEGDLDDWLYEL